MREAKMLRTSSRREKSDPRAVAMFPDGFSATTPMNFEIAFFISPLYILRIISFLQLSSLLAPGYLN